MLVGGAAIGKEMATILRITFGSIQASRAELTYFLKDPYFDPSMGLSLREQSGGNKGYDAPPPSASFHKLFNSNLYFNMICSWLSKNMPEFSLLKLVVRAKLVVCGDQMARVGQCLRKRLNQSASA